MTPESFTNWFRKLVKAVVDDQGDRLLPDGLSPHGLRKATCPRLAESGCSAHEIMSISGHQTLAEVTRYTVAANRVQLAERAVAALERKEMRTQTAKPDLRIYKTVSQGIDLIGRNWDMVGDSGIEPDVGLPGGVTVRCRTLQHVAQTCAAE